MEGPRYERRYDLDWLRVLAFTLLILFHTGMMFNGWDWHVKNPTRSKEFEYVMIFLNQWRMPLLFVISGAAVWFAMEKYSTGRFAWERVKRLLLPLAFGMLVIIPPQVYYERLFQGETYSFWTFYETIFDFRPYPEGNFSWHHLWYIPYIFVYSLLMLPIFRYFKGSRGRRQLRQVMQWLSVRSSILLGFVPIALTQVVLRPYWPDNYNNLFGDWSQFTATLLLFSAGYFLASSPEIWPRLESLRRKSLVAGVTTSTLLYGVWYLEVKLPLFPESLYWVLKSANTWFWVISILGFGSRYLRFNNRFLKYANQAVYPFYILHQTITVIVGYYLVNWSAGVGVKFLALALATFLGSWGIYEGLIRRLNWIRPLFGLKLASIGPSS